MVEKYDVVDITRRAGGGEYPAQDGFGWTNGVAIALIAEQRAAAPSRDHEHLDQIDSSGLHGVPASLR